MSPVSTPVPRLLLFADVTAAHRRARGVLQTLARAFVDVADAVDVGVVVRVGAGDVDVDLAAFVAAVAAVCRRAGARVLAHNDARLAVALRLDGVHLKAAQSVRLARLALPRGALVGQSWHGESPLAGRGRGERPLPPERRGVDAAQVVDVDADYVTCSPVFAPGSKPHDTRPPLGFAGLAAGVARARVPVLALGGIDETHGRACRRAGAHGVAVISSLFAAHDPARALQALRASVRA
jgi:thiamine-phosphate pyrophosphorylase